ncbi:hypothetical protein GCM10023311_24380 [Flaviramulus aquimarinus]|uniref:Lipopolysaccharide export system permease protein n=2 Tax=Flaviramulus aquimarinus TaxID=1170456 RepID=A0ABP9FDH4_9FLAO
MLIFILQTIWLYIKELAGKDLDIMVIVKFLVYFMPKLIPLVLPLTILLASIMVFGSFAENYEFAAMKSTGISLQRAMTGLSVFIVILAVITFFFSNNVIPWAELNSHNLRRNIAKLKPAMVIAEGQFNEIGTYNIKVEEKIGERDLKDVTIHIKGKNGRKNATTIKSKTGKLVSSEESEVIKLILFDGHFYNDVSRKRIKDRNKNPFVKSSFEKKIINIDLSTLNNVDFDEQTKTDNYNMLNVSGLNKTIDSLTKKSKSNYEALSISLHQRANLKNKIKQKSRKKDSVYSAAILDLFTTKKKTELVDAAFRAVTNSKQFIHTKKSSIQTSKAWLNRHIISLHQKYALGFACIILFFVGAPLGALIRKGGIGLPMVIAILLFLTYHFIGIFATNSAKTGDFNPILASWFSTLVMLPLGIFLTKRATADRGLFEFGGVIEPLKRAFNIKEKNTVDYKFLYNYNNEELVDVVNNYQALGHEKISRHEAIKVLKSRGITTKQFQDVGIAIDQNFETSEAIKNNYKDHAVFAIVLYSIGIVLLILFFVFKNNKLLPLSMASIELSIVSLVLFIVYFIKSFINASQFYNHINKEHKKPKLIILLLGLPLYMITYIFLNEKIKEDLKLNCLESLK